MLSNLRDGILYFAETPLDFFFLLGNLFGPQIQCLLLVTDWSLTDDSDK